MVLSKRKNGTYRAAAVGIRMAGETAREEKSHARYELTAANAKIIYKPMIPCRRQKIKRVTKNEISM